MAEILVAVDGSASSAAALRVGIDLARSSGDSIVFVTAWRELRGDFGLPYETIVAPDVVGIERDWATDTLANAVEQAKASGVSAEAVARHGRPAHEIVAVARERGVRLIVLGSHGFGPIEGVVFGSVSHGVLHHAPCPVVVCPPLEPSESPT